MKPCLADVNIWLALLCRRHVHHASARQWFDALGPHDAGLWRVVQLALLRLLGNAVVMGDDAIPAAEAWNVITELLEDDRVEFLSEPLDLDLLLPTLFRYPVPTRSLIGDAYLAAFAIASSRTVVTRDRGFRQFRGLDVEFLGD